MGLGNGTPGTGAAINIVWIGLSATPILLNPETTKNPNMTTLPSAASSTLRFVTACSRTAKQTPTPTIICLYNSA